MTVILPTPVASAASSWQLADWRELQLHTDPAAGGTATLETGQVPDTELWLIDRMVAACDSTEPTQLRVYVNYVTALGVRDGSSRGNFDVTEYPQGLLVRGGTTLIAQWTGASDGAVGVLTVQARVYRRG